ncbi:hypothetical protein [Mycobacterium sp.]|uniref:hypothetical protein n=1 Tax=Mycobacterium sp. TaxID=1785 RepID=UPI003C722CF1
MRHRGVVELTQGILPITTDTHGVGGLTAFALKADARTDAEIYAAETGATVESNRAEADMPASPASEAVVPL